jgi:hypothetical protein
MGRISLVLDSLWHWLTGLLSQRKEAKKESNSKSSFESLQTPNVYISITLRKLQMLPIGN